MKISKVIVKLLEFKPAAKPSNAPRFKTFGCSIAKGLAATQAAVAILSNTLRHYQVLCHQAAELEVNDLIEHPDKIQRVFAER